jgi:Kdo2-lipid IVA lauroyltransferase/acyltransferase
MKYRPKHIAEYILVRIVAGVARRLPYRLALGYGWAHAAFMFYVLRFRVAEAERRIHSVFGTQYTAREVRRIAWQSWLNMCLSIIEIVRIRHGVTHRLPPGLELAQQQALHDHAATGRGAILACPHIGNWELAGILAPLNGLSIFTVTGVLKNPLVNAFVQRLRESPNVEIIERGSGAMRVVIRKLKQGKMLAIMPDLRSRAPGVDVRFLGGHANVYPGIGLFARQTGVPIFVTAMRRFGRRRQRFEVYGPFEPDQTLPKDQDIVRLTQLTMDRIDALIREDPGQWFWFNKRWILDPLDDADRAATAAGSE